jgi:hypothetical protein
MFVDKAWAYPRVEHLKGASTNKKIGIQGCNHKLGLNPFNIDIVGQLSLEGLMLGRKSIHETKFRCSCLKVAAV